jgi:hypothetical protein
MYWCFRVKIRRSTNVAKSTVGGMAPNKVCYNIIETKDVIVKFEKKHPFLICEKIICPKFI